jgi:hypothetical protein
MGGGARDPGSAREPAEPSSSRRGRGGGGAGGYAAYIQPGIMQMGGRAKTREEVPPAPPYAPQLGVASADS